MNNNQHDALAANEVAKLLAEYRFADHRLLQTPAFSLRPIATFVIRYVWLIFATLADLILVIPINLIIVILNAVSQTKRKYFSLSYASWKYIVLYIWRAEMSFALIHFRFLSRRFLHAHFVNRLRYLRSCISVLPGVGEEARDEILKDINWHLDLWSRTNVTNRAVGLMLVYIIPLVGFGITVGVDANQLKALYEASLSIGLPIVVAVAYVFLLLFPAQCFAAKRACMLNREGRGLYFPGGSGDRGVYAKERETFGALGIRRPPETSFDILYYFFLSALLLYFGALFAYEIESFYHTMQEDDLRRSIDGATGAEAEQLRQELSTLEQPVFYQILFASSIAFIPYWAVLLYFYVRRRIAQRM